MKKVKPIRMWGVLWRSKNKLDGEDKHLMFFGSRIPALFHSRQEARDWINDSFGYIRNRPDLKAEPHGWRLPIPIRVRIEVKDER